MYKRILVATGGSPWSDAAVAYAIRLAAHTDAEVRIVTVLTDPAPYMTSEFVPAYDMLLETMEQDGKARLHKAVAYAAWAGVAYDTILAWGPVPHTILQTVEAEACDLIILGSRHLTGWKRLQLGSIVNIVAAKARQPVLVIKQTAPLTPEMQGWRRILVPTGGSPWSEAAIEHALRLAQTQDSTVCFLHVAQLRSTRDEATARARGQQILAAAAARAVDAGIPYEIRFDDGHVVTSIVETATNAQCDGIVLGSHGLSGWKRLMLGSVANAVAAKATQPVLIVKHFGDGEHPAGRCQAAR